MSQKRMCAGVRRYMEAYERLSGSDSHIEALSASNAAEAATTLAAVADMMLKMGEIEEATTCLTTSLDLLSQHPGQLPALQVACTVLLVCPHSLLSLHPTLWIQHRLLLLLLVHGQCFPQVCLCAHTVRRIPFQGKWCAHSCLLPPAPPLECCLLLKRRKWSGCLLLCR